MNDNSLTERTAVLYDQHPLWLDAVEAVMTRISVKVIGNRFGLMPAYTCQMTLAKPNVFFSGNQFASGPACESTASFSGALAAPKAAAVTPAAGIATRTAWDLRHSGAADG